MNRKALAMLLVFVLILGSFSMSAGAETDAQAEATTVQTVTFNDVNNHWAKDAIYKWSDNGIINGYQGLFRPDDSITRGEMAVILDNMMDYQEAAKNTFADLKAGQFYTDAVLKANASGIIKGDGNTVRPADKISREEAAVMLGRAFGIKESTSGSVSFNDASSIASWSKGYVTTMAAKGYLKGTNNNFNPKIKITRAEIVTIIDNVVKAYYTKADTYTENVNGTAIIKVTGVTLKGVTISENLIIAEGVGNGDVTLDSVTVKGDTIVRGGGENSVHITGTSDITTVRIERIGDTVRIVVSDGNTVQEIEVAVGEEIIISGTVGTVEVASPNTTIIANDANIGNVNVESTASNTTIQTGSGSTIGTVNAEAQVNVSGQGTVTKVNLNEGADNSSITTPKTQIDVAENVSGATGGGGTSIPGGNTGTNNSSGNSATVGGTIGGGSSSTAVTDISVSPTAITLLSNGETGTIAATVTPSNATNKTVTWSSSDESVAQVSNGVITPLNSGTVTITALAGAKTATCEVVVGDILITSSGSIQTAINSASDGAILLVDTGTYREKITINKNLMLKAVKNHTAVIEGNIIVDSSVDDFTIEGFKIQAYGGDNPYSLGAPYNTALVSDADRSVVKNNLFQGIDSPQGPYTYAALVNITGDEVLLKGNIIDQVIDIAGDPNAAYIKINTSGSGIVEDNVLTAALGIATGEDSSIDVNNNTVNDASKEGIWFWPVDSTSEILINDNVIDDYDAGNNGSCQLKITNKPASINGIKDGSAMLSKILADNQQITTLELEWVKTVGTGYEYSTIQDAINAAHDGDTILVGAGEYEIDSVLDDLNTKNLSVMGVGDQTVLKAVKTQNTVLTADHNVKFKDLKITGYFHINNTLAINYNFEFDNITFDYAISGETGLGLWGSKSTLVQNSRFSGPMGKSGSALNIFKGYGTVERTTVVRDNTFDYSNISAIDLRGCQTQDIENVTISGNTFTGNTAAVLNVVKAFQIAGNVITASITDNTISNARVGIMLHDTLVNTANVTLSANTFTNCVRNTLDERIETLVVQGESIQSAITAASDGSKIYLAAGTYTGNLVIPGGKSLTLIGPNSGISGSGNRVSESIISGSSITINSSIVIDGLKFESGNIAIKDGDNVTIKNSAFTGYVKSITADGSNVSGSDITIDHNKFSNVNYAVYVDEGSISTISNNIVDGARKGLGVGSNSTAYFDSNILKNCTETGIEYFPTSVTNSDNIETTNEFEGCTKNVNANNPD